MSIPSEGQPQFAVVLIGPPGSGKTTLARCLADQHAFALLETGNLLETEVKSGTKMGERILPFKRKGELVPPDLVQEVIAQALARATEKWVLFDGFPRSAAQTQTLTDLLRDHHLSLTAVIVFTVDLDLALQRLGRRRVCLKCGAISNLSPDSTHQTDKCKLCGGLLVQRPDDRPEIIRERFRVYHTETAPVIEFFRREFPAQTWEEPADAAPKVLADRLWDRLEKLD